MLPPVNGQCAHKAQTPASIAGFRYFYNSVGSIYNKMPAIQADMKFASVPTTIAFTPRRARSDFREGASAPIPPIWIAIELRFANPHKAKVAMTNER